MKFFPKINESKIAAQAYSEFKTDISRYNLTIMRQISMLGSVAGILLVIASLPPLRILNLFYGYATIAALFILIFVLCCTVLPKHENAILPVYYGFIAFNLVIMIMMGTYLGQDSNAVTFIVMILISPLFIIDKPYKMHLLTGVMSILFCVIDLQVKSGRLLELDLANCIVFYLLSIPVSHQVINTKMADIIIKHELKQQRDVDMLTQLNNRGAFERIVAQYIHESNKNAIMLIMDVDNFKSVNDTMGHAYGDMILQLVGEYLKSTFRSGDIVSRLGGDEFVAFLPAVEDINIITGKVQTLIDRVGGINTDSESPCKISVSIGLAQYPEDGCSFETLYKQADSALYAAKKSGKGRYMLYKDQNDQNKETAIG